MLTKLGHQQCDALRSNLEKRFAREIEASGNIAVIASPMRRTLETTLRSLDWVLARGVTIEANADWQGKRFALLYSTSTLIYH